MRRTAAHATFALVCVALVVANAAVPSAPTGLHATPLFRSAVLHWDMHADTTVTGYRVYRSNTSGSGYSNRGWNPSSRTATEYADAEMTNGTTYYYVITAVNGDGESGYSNEAVVTPTADCAVDVPYITSSWWRIGENEPDVSPYNNPGVHNACDFTIWKDDARKWHCVACIRITTYPGSTRLFHRWDADSITQANWTPAGLFWTTGTVGAADALGRTMGVNTPYTVEGRLQAPHCFLYGGTYYMFHNNAGAFCLASNDGDVFSQHTNYQGGSVFFSMGRDVMIFNNVAQDGKWYAYYCTSGMVARSASNLDGPWSATESTVRSAGNPESPFAVEHGSGIYLWQQNGVVYSTDPLDFNGDPITFMWRGKYAPEIIEDDGNYYVSGYGGGIWVARMAWWPAQATPARPSASRSPAGSMTRVRDRVAWYDLRGRRVAPAVKVVGVRIAAGRDAAMEVPLGR